LSTPAAPALYGPVQDDLRFVEETLFAIQQVEFPALARMLEHILGATGKRIRPAMALLAGNIENYDLDRLVPLAASIELLHSATLVHDDVIDAAATRRGRATANALFMNGPTVMVGDYMFAHAAELIARTGSIEVIRLFARTLMEMASGELHQDMSAYEYSSSTIKYFHRIAGKTASLFATAAKGGAMISGLREDWIECLRSYGENVGMCFQVVDDILDFTGDEEEMGKPVGSDLMQGTLTLPSLFIIDRYPADNPVKRYFEGRKKAESLRRSIDMVRNSDILGDSYKVAGDFRDRALDALSGLPHSDAVEALAGLADWAMQRRS
jgi:octaprenyl-diphosphate synthase